MKTTTKYIKTIYQGPGRPGIFVRSGSVLKKIRLEHVGWSLLRTFTSLEWEPLITVMGENTSIKNCFLTARGTAILVIPDVVVNFRTFTQARIPYIERKEA